MEYICPHCEGECMDTGSPPGTNTACPHCGKLFQVPVPVARIKQPEPSPPAEGAGTRRFDWSKVEHARNVRKRVKKSVSRINEGIAERKAKGLTCPNCDSRQTKETFGSGIEKTGKLFSWGRDVMSRHNETWRCSKCGHTWRP